MIDNCLLEWLVNAILMFPLRFAYGHLASDHAVMMSLVCLLKHPPIHSHGKNSDIKREYSHHHHRVFYSY